jgi:nitrogen fixation protein FixH
MKFNWGTGIALFFSIFVLSLVYVVYQTTLIDNSLVFDDYYAKDLAYQQHYDKLQNAMALKEKVEITNSRSESKVSIQFPRSVGNVSGEITFFCPSHSKSDFKLAVAPDQDFLQQIDSKGLRKGLWKVRINWEAAGKEFYSEETIVL